MRSNPILLDLRLSVVCVHICCFSFSEEKMFERKKQLVQDFIPPLGIYIHMCTSYTYTNTCMPRFGPSEPSRCLIPTPGLTSEYSVGAMCVCVCVYTHIHPHTLPSALNLKNREDTDNTHIFPSAKEQTPTPSNKGFHRRAETPYPHSPMLNETNCTCMCAYAHPVASVQQMCMLMFTTSV